MQNPELNKDLATLLTDTGWRKACHDIQSLNKGEDSLLKSIAEIPELNAEWSIRKGCVQFDKTGVAEDILKKVSEILKSFKPWRKGPFQIFGTFIDSEWCSNLKWNRIQQMVAPYLKDARILDIGCNNGYYFFPMQNISESFIRVGIDPVLKYGQHWLFWNKISHKVYDYLPWGVDDLHYFKQKTFDVIFCMGILYHHPSPVTILRNMYDALSSEGVIILETMGIVHGDSICVIPEKTYAGMKNVYHVPSERALQAMIRKSGFMHMELMYKGCLQEEEQRSTEWSSPVSLREFLDQDDSNMTQEGYPRPWRYYYILSKKKRG